VLLTAGAAHRRCCSPQVLLTAGAARVAGWQYVLKHGEQAG